MKVLATISATDFKNNQYEYAIYWTKYLSSISAPPGPLS